MTTKIVGTSKVDRYNRIIITPILKELSVSIGDSIEFTRRDKNTVAIKKTNHQN